MLYQHLGYTFRLREGFLMRDPCFWLICVDPAKWQERRGGRSVEFPDEAVYYRYPGEGVTKVALDVAVSMCEAVREERERNGC